MTKQQIDFSTVLASSVHDMKNSLCLLIQSIEHIGDKLKDTQQNEAKELAQVHYEASRLNSNLLQILAMYRADKNELPIFLDEYYIDDLVAELMAKNSFYFQNKNITVDYEIETDLAWYFDNDLITNLLNDIFVNAMRYCKSNIHIQAFEKENKLHIVIADDGNGYPDNMLISPTSSPSQVDLSASRTGLGIYFAQLIAQSHQQNGQAGSISLQNGGRLNGSVFTLVLP